MHFPKGSTLLRPTNLRQSNLRQKVQPSGGDLALFDLLICSTMKMGLLIPCAGDGRDLDAIFAEKVPKGKGRRARDTTTQYYESVVWRVGTEILAYLKPEYLIYSASFKDPTAEQRRSIHEEFTEAGAERFADFIRSKMKQQLECWYAKYQPSNQRVLPKNDDNYIGGSDGVHQPV